MSLGPIVPSPTSTMPSSDVPKKMTAHKPQQQLIFFLIDGYLLKGDLGAFLFLGPSCEGGKVVQPKSWAPASSMAARSNL